MEEVVVGYVPVRMGTKRAPGKNTFVLDDKPAFAHVATTLAQVSRIDRVMVSSDDEDVLDLAADLGFVPLRRAPHLALDHVSVLEVVRAEATHFGSFDAVAVVYATAVLVRSSSVSDMVMLCAQHDWRMPVVAVTPFRQPLHQALALDDEGLVEAVFPDLAGVRSQDVPPTFVDAGGAYVLPRSFVLEHQGFYSGRLVPFFIREDEALDVDTPAHLAELARRFAARNG